MTDGHTRFWEGQGKDGCCGGLWEAIAVTGARGPGVVAEHLPSFPGGSHLPGHCGSKPVHSSLPHNELLIKGEQSCP